MSTEFFGALLTIGLLALVIIVVEFNFGSSLTKALVIAGAGLAVVAALLYHEWRSGTL